MTPLTDKPWLASYPPGVSAEIDPDRYDSLADLIESNFERFAGAPAFSNRGTTLTFDDVERLSRAFAAYLQSVLGLSHGDRVAVMLPNLLQSPVVLFGILRAGMVVVNVNPLYTARELEHQLSDSGASVIIVLENFANTVEQVLSHTKLKAVLITRVGDHFPLLKRVVTNLLVKRIKRLVPSFSIDGAVDYRAALKQGRRVEFEPPSINGDDIAFLQYTGGTTGRAKGAMLTQRNIVSNVLQCKEWFEPVFAKADGDVLTALPLYHVFALTVNLFTFMELGGHNVLITNPRDLRVFVAELKSVRLAFMTGVNTLFNALLNVPEFATLDFREFKMCLGGGMAVQRDVAERWQQLTGVMISQGYGLTETSPVVTASPLNATEFNGSVGLPLPSTEVSIVDDSGVHLGVVQTGEICVRGPQVTPGYWNRPKETAAVFLADGWLLTGDIGRVDSNGFVFIEDRKKDLIIVSGFNVYPNEIEDVVMTHPGVLEAAAVGIDDEESGEVVKLFVVKKNAELSEHDLTAHCRERLTGYKRPKVIVFVDELPKSNVGKVLRRQLRDQSP